MKIGFTGLELEVGKVKYNDNDLEQLVEKCDPKKVVPYYVELIEDEYIQTEAIIMSRDSILDLLIHDMEACETRIERTEDPKEKAVFQKCLENLEAETPLCDVQFTPEEKPYITASALLSRKPVLVVDGEPDTNEIIGQALKRAGKIFFYTAGPKEVHAWDIDAGSSMLEAAGRIHSDLARGFIKADVLTIEEFMASHNFNDAKKQGLVKVVDRDHPIEAGNVIEIRFNV